MQTQQFAIALHSARRGLLALALAATAFAVDAAAQCPRPDGLDGGPCCTLAQSRFPTVPKFQQGALGICWRQCDVEQADPYTAVWSPYLSSPPGSNCKPLVKRLRLINSAGILAWSGNMIQQYSRTWMETDPTGAQLQVWRFLVNGDLVAMTGAGGSPCPVPPCASDFNGRVRFTGYLDMARDCAAGGAAPTEYAWMITHSCDLIDHAPGFPRGGAYHPDRTYTFVGPSAGFVVGPFQPPYGGGTPLEAVRRVRYGTGTGPQCEFEEQIDAALVVQQELCLCGTVPIPFQYLISDLGLAGSCGTSITTPGGPFLPGYISMGIGSWTDPTRYPGQESLRWNCGGYDYFDPCTGVTRQEVFFGVTTLNGFESFQVTSAGVGLPLPTVFVDQANSLKGASTLMNLPFRSDHILNLNF